MTAAEAAQILSEKDNFLLLTHTRPDGDTMGSAAALCHALRSIGKTAHLYNNPQFKDCMPWVVEPYLAPSDYIGEYTIAIDIASDRLFPQGYKGGAKLCIDHHGSNTGYAEETVLMPKKASCGEVVMDIIKRLCGGIDKIAADLLYIAVSTDTGCFTYGNTTGETLHAAAELVDAGACNTALNKILFRTSSKARIALEGLIYASMRYYHDGKTAFAFITEEMLSRSGATENDCIDISALPGRVEGVAVSAVIRESAKKRCKISLRTNGLVNASHVCASFDGGGHAMAAGCEIDGDIDEAAALLEKVIAEAMQ